MSIKMIRAEDGKIANVHDDEVKTWSKQGWTIVVEPKEEPQEKPVEKMVNKTPVKAFSKK